MTRGGDREGQLCMQIVTDALAWVRVSALGRDTRKTGDKDNKWVRTDTRRHTDQSKITVVTTDKHSRHKTVQSQIVQDISVSWKAPTCFHKKTQTQTHVNVRGGKYSKQNK